MKKLTVSYRRWLAVRKRSEARKRYEHQHGRLTPVLGVVTDNDGRWVARVSKKDELPGTLCLDVDRDGTLEFFNDLRVRTIQPARTRPRPVSKKRGRIRWIKAYVDFQPLKIISPGAALILAAEYDRIRRTRTLNSSAIDIEKWDKDVYRRLYQLGFFELLGINPERLSALPGPLQTSEYLTPMFCGNDTDLREPGEKLLDLFVAVGGDDASRVQLLGAVADAIENVKGHAYEGMNHPGIPHLWWMSGSADQEARKLTLSIYDQGISIPVTLPNKWSKDALGTVIQSIVRGGSVPDITDPKMDGYAVAAAMRMSKTSSGLEERGKGLTKIRKAVADCAGGRLRVISRRGNYLFENGVETFESLPVPLHGTYIGIEATFNEGGGK